MSFNLNNLTTNSTKSQLEAQSSALYAWGAFQKPAADLLTVSCPSSSGLWRVSQRICRNCLEISTGIVYLQIPILYRIITLHCWRNTHTQIRLTAQDLSKNLKQQIESIWQPKTRMLFPFAHDQILHTMCPYAHSMCIRTQTHTVYASSTFMALVAIVSKPSVYQQYWHLE